MTISFESAPVNARFAEYAKKYGVVIPHTFVDGTEIVLEELFENFDAVLEAERDLHSQLNCG